MNCCFRCKQDDVLILGIYCQSCHDDLDAVEAAVKIDKFEKFRVQSQAGIEATAWARVDLLLDDAMTMAEIGALKIRIAKYTKDDVVSWRPYKAIVRECVRTFVEGLATKGRERTELLLHACRLEMLCQDAYLTATDWHQLMKISERKNWS